MSRMAVCKLCHCLDYQELFQQEANELCWLSEDISVLYEENRATLEKIKKLNMELEEFLGEDYPDNSYDDPITDNCDETIGMLWREDELTALLWREEELRGLLLQQLQTLSQHVSSHLQHQPPVQHHLWGHLSRRWRPTTSGRQSPPSCRLSPPSPSQAGTQTNKTWRRGRLHRWILKRMPHHFMDLL
eukprot:GFUD01118376.1.p1 GENE.GFUD01118376.1~~GFUD01118376.1.p1  ORF type:complete len:188 (+),score=41.66 GFUD01118376.1:348-911(+)